MMQLTRADFVKSAAAFGALVLGVGAELCVNESAAAAPATANFTPNAWLIVHANGKVTIFIAKSEMGQGVATGMSTIVADELDIPYSAVQIQFADAGDAYRDPLFHLQMTGGSTSTTASFVPLRTAGASARAMLIAAAAQQWNVASATCTTKAGVVYHAPSRRSVPYAELIAAASAQPVPAAVTLKTPAQFTLIGKTFPRIDLPAKINGSAHYGIDVRVPGMRFASIEPPPTFGGSVASFDATKAKAVHGVIDVIQVPMGIAVVAENSWAAFQGRAALQITWNPGPNADLDSDKMYADRTLLAKSRQGANVAVNTGDVTAAKGRVFEAIYTTPYLAHAPMEPMNATASVTAAGVEVWAPTQSQTLGRAGAAAIAGVTPDKVTLHTTYLGGAFGRRLVSDYVEQAVAVSKAMRMPIQIIWRREDDTQRDYFRAMSVNALRGVLDDAGNLISLDHTAVAESCLKPLLGPGALKNGVDSAQMYGINNVEYTIPNYRGSYIEVEYGLPITTMRAPGANSNSFALEAFIDELAFAAEKDPLAYRLALLGKSPRAANVLRVAADRAHWGHPATPGAKHGVAFAFWEHTPAAIIVEVTLEDNKPKVHKATIVADPGLVVNPDIVIAQLEGSLNFGLSMALTGNITLKNGRIQQHNFDQYTVLHMPDAPDIDAHFIASTEPPTGIGEVGVPPIGPAIANALFAITGKRIRSLPFSVALAPA